MAEQDSRYQQLIDPFEEQDVEWRVQQSGVSGNGKPWVMVIPYITNRAIQQRLDDVFGFDGWHNEYRETADGKGYLCGITFISESGEWITKWDGSEYTNIEPLKGALSGSMKRTGAQVGIGRYLYNLSEEFATCKIATSRFDVVEPWQYIAIKDKKNPNGPRIQAQWLPPQLPAWAKPSFKKERYMQLINTTESIEELRKIYSEAMSYAKSFRHTEFARELKELVDVKVESIKSAYSASAEGKAKTLFQWLDSQIENLISSAPNESVVRQAGSQISAEIKVKSEEQNIKPDAYIERLKSACKDRASKLNQPTEQ